MKEKHSVQRAVLRNSGSKLADNFVGICNIVPRSNVSVMPLLLPSRFYIMRQRATAQWTIK
jgi:hypothetical protein